MFVLARSASQSQCAPRRSLATKKAAASKEEKAPLCASPGFGAQPKAQTVPQALAKMFEDNEHKDAFRDVRHDFRWTRRELKTFVMATGAGMVGNKHDAQSRCLAVLGQESENAVSFLAALHANVVYASAPPAATNQQIEDALFSVAPASLVLPLQRVDDSRAIVPELCAPEYTFFVGTPLRSRSFPSLRSVVQLGRETVCGLQTFNDLLAYDPLPHPLPARMAAQQPDDVAALTLLPHPSDGGLHLAAAFTHRQLLAGARTVIEWSGIQANDRVCSVLPMHTTTGQVTGLLAPLLAGALSVYPGSASFDAVQTLSTLQREHCSMLLATPAQLGALLEHAALATTALGELRRVCIVADAAEHRGSALLSAQHRQLLTQALPHVELRGALATSEALLVLAGIDSFSPLAGVETRVNKGSNTLAVRSSTAMTGFYNKPDETARVLSADGWLATLVAASQDTAGRLQLV